MFFTDDLQSAAASFARVVGVVQLGGAPPPTLDQPVLERGFVQLTGVGFGYLPGHPVLSDIDLTIGAGEHVAVVGASGSGKTTLARLIAGSHQPDRGQVHRAVNRTEVAYLTREHHVFAGTLRDNLDLALTPTDAQLLALARLAIKRPHLAILDEATAEADARDTVVLDRAMRRVIAGRSAVLIAHRLSQAVGCDRIVVLERGRIVEQGAHHELAQASGRYAELWAAWSRGPGRRDGECIVASLAGILG